MVTDAPCRRVARWRFAAVSLALALPVAASAQSGNTGVDILADPGISTGYSTEFSTEPVFSPVFTSPVQQLFSPPEQFYGVDTTTQLPTGLLATDTTLDTALVQPASVDPTIAPMATTLGTLPNPVHRHPPYAAQSQEGMATYFCLTQAQQNAQVNRYWSLIAPAEPQVAQLPGFAASSAPDREAANDPADTNDQWCSANLPTPWAVEPFDMNVWGVVIVLSLGIAAFWTARGFKSP